MSITDNDELIEARPSVSSHMFLVSIWIIINLLWGFSYFLNKRIELLPILITTFFYLAAHISLIQSRIELHNNYILYRNFFSQTKKIEFSKIKNIRTIIGSKNYKERFLPLERLVIKSIYEDQFIINIKCFNKKDILLIINIVNGKINKNCLNQK